ncbi:lysozyme g-like [Clavelina lepadiformis]|uniref:lysozyme g-like n=1 Tax=Clavelina lepadiformis TaxID=159417 RepID=UPI0040421F3F
MKPNNFGNIGKVNPTGASASTAKSDDLTCSGNHKYMVCCLCSLHDVLGVRASRQIAKNDLNRIKKYDPDIKISAKEYEMDAAVLAGTISSDNWWFFFTGAHQAGRKNLADNLERVKAKHTDWSPEQQLQVSIAAYNYGPGNVRTWENLDIGTTSNDYSNDVMTRARFYRENGFING